MLLGEDNERVRGRLLRFRAGEGQLEIDGHFSLRGKTFRFDGDSKDEFLPLIERQQGDT